MIPGIIAGAWRKRDPYWSSVVLAMHMDNTGLTDVKGNTVTLNGGAARSSAQSKFGGYSAYLDGNGDYLSLADSAGLTLGGGDFTIEGFIRLAAWPSLYSSDYYCALLAKDASGSREFSVQLVGTATSYATLRFVGFSDNTTSTTVDGSISLSLNTWYHLAVVRSGNTVYLFLDGALLNAGGTAFSRTLQNTSGALKVGGHLFDGTYLGYMNGYFDELRITKSAKWTAGFTVPTEAYPDA